MFKTVFLIFLFAHILGDFYFQTSKIAKQKITSFGSVKKHCLIYTATVFLIISSVYNPAMLISGISMAVSHALVDIIKYFITKDFKEKGICTPEKDRILYVSDQLVHVAFLLIIAFVYTANTPIITELPFIRSAFEIMGLSIQKTFKYLLILLLIWKPANITVEKLLSIHKPMEKILRTKGNEDVKMAGGFIGFAERLIIVVLLVINQYSAIGLVLTAKSIARYDRISKDQTFAEYYLLGTLLSTFIVLIVYLSII